MRDLEATLKAVETIRNIIETYSAGWRNEEALKAVEAELFRLGVDNSDPYILEKIGSIKERANILYSPRKVERYGGVENVRSQIYGDCNSIRSAATRLARTNDDEH